jgi:nicotinamidase-related amidase
MALTLNAQKTAVLVIDMQNAFLDPKGSIARMGIPIERAAGVIETLAAALGTLLSLPRWKRVQWAISLSVLPRSSTSTRSTRPWGADQ